MKFRDSAVLGLRFPPVLEIWFPPSNPLRRQRAPRRLSILLADGVLGKLRLQPGPGVPPLPLELDLRLSRLASGRSSRRCVCSGQNVSKFLTISVSIHEITAALQQASDLDPAAVHLAGGAESLQRRLDFVPGRIPYERRTSQTGREKKKVQILEIDRT